MITEPPACRRGDNNAFSFSKVQQIMREYREYCYAVLFTPRTSFKPRSKIKQYSETSKAYNLFT